MIAQGYPEHFLAPMREELTRIGFEELRTPESVDAAVNRPGTTMIVVNSVCGCAAGKARPGIATALQRRTRPDHLGTVFAGGDIEATARAREHFAPYPAVVSVGGADEGRQARLHDGAPRNRDERPDGIAARLRAALDQHCA